MLVRAKQCRPLQPPPPPSRHRDLSVVTEEDVKRAVSLQRKPMHVFVTNEQKSIRHHITSSSSNLIYMIRCNKCKILYKGKTKRRLSDRFIDLENTHAKLRKPSHNLTSINPPPFLINSLSLAIH